MTDQEFLSQNLDVLYQNLSFPSLTKNWIFFKELLELNSVSISFFVISFILALFAFAIYVLSYPNTTNIDSTEQNKGIVYIVFQTIATLIALWIPSFFVTWFVFIIISTAPLGSNYIKIDELNNLPILKEGDNIQRDYFKKLVSQYVLDIERIYPNQDDFNSIIERGPDLETVTYWLIETIKDKPYNAQKTADEKLKLINDM